MNRTETVTLLRVIRGLCPDQRFDEFTPDGWSDALADVPAGDAMAAVRTVYAEQGDDRQWGPRRIEADDVLRQVKRIRAKRIDDAPAAAFIPPPGLSVVEETEWLRDARRRAGDGEKLPTDTRGELVERRYLKALAARAEDAERERRR